MAIVHFLNVGNGDCSVIEHSSQRVTVIDVCKARDPSDARVALDKAIRALTATSSPRGNFNQKDNPENPIEYLRARGISAIHRFILSHPDMDHMDGIKAFFDAFPVTNFWDTDNTAEKEFAQGSPFDEADWELYERLRRGAIPGITRLALHAGTVGKYWNQTEDGSSSDGLHVLAPTAKLVGEANACRDFNDCSYVVLYRVENFKILFCGDSHDKTWEHILANHPDEIRNVDVLVAPHHGRHSDRDFSFLDVTLPLLTLFGNAPSEHLAYQAWSQRGLAYVTNNQAGTVILDVSAGGLRVLFTNEAYARRVDPQARYDAALNAWHAATFAARKAMAA